MAPYQLLGLGGSPILLQPGQLHGDRERLMKHPDTMHLYIRPLRTPKKGKSTPKTTRREGWHAFQGKRMPNDAQVTIFQDTVYDCLQHALFACLLWYAGGLSGKLKYCF